MKPQEREQLDQWMTRLANGDREAFVPVFECVWPIVRRFAERSLKSAADADDVAQEALLRLFSRASEFDTTRHALPWALGITAYECRTFRRKASRRREESDGRELERARHRGATPEDDVIERDLEAAAMEVLGTLAPSDVEAILSAGGHGKRPAIPGATFRKRLERASARLRFAWRAKHGSE